MKLNIIFSILPVLVFLMVFNLLDSYKLVRIKTIYQALLWGVVAAGLSYVFNLVLNVFVDFEFNNYAKYLAPFVEEILKAVFVYYLIKKHQIGFMIDGAIIGFSIGTSFAFLENIFYINELVTDNTFVRVLRGFGTSIMHGGTTAIVAIITMLHTSKKLKSTLKAMMPGLLIGMLIHFFFNSFIVSTLATTLITFVTVPIVIIITFNISESLLRKWLEIEFHTESELLLALKNGRFSETRAGEYFHSIKDRFSPEIIVDLLCYIQLYLELSIKAKAILMLNELDIEYEKEESIKNRITEFKFLRKSIGKVGLIALKPILRFSKRDLWKIHLLEE